MNNLIDHMLIEIARRTKKYTESLDKHVAHYSKLVIGRELANDEILVIDTPGIGRHFYDNETRKCFMFEAEPELEPNGVLLKVTSVNIFKDEK
jgi:hypothetical protein